MSRAPLAESVKLSLAALRAVDLPLLERMVRAYYVEDGHAFDAERFSWDSI